MSTVFTTDDYVALINDLLERGYVTKGYSDIEPNNQHLLLRHDIDMSIDAAVEMAVIETSISVSSVYFVLLRSNLYNPFSSRGLEGLNEILKLGHSIGLHFDASLYNDDFDELEAACQVECEIMESVVKTPVNTISFHRPAKSLLNISGRFAGRIHAYEPRFFKQMGYCSDSRGKWGFGHPMEHEAVINKKAFQLLTHPIWWVGKKGESITERLDGLAKNDFYEFRKDMADNCEPYSPSI